MHEAAVVAGHICLDVIPELHEGSSFEPGKLIEVGRPTISTGGAVSNTGLALDRLGIPVRLVGKVGNDLMGRAIRDLLGSHAREMVVAPGELTSYTIVLSPPGVDRMFLHAPGCNDTFTADDVPDEALEGARLMHFGYPPLMARMVENEGRELEALLHKAKAAGLTTSLDMALPDPDSAAGRADWRAILARALPHCDLFLPSTPELLFMLDRPAYDGLKGGEVPEALCPKLADEALAMGARAVGLKAGGHGLYLKVGRSLTGKAAVHGWEGAELWARPFKVEVAGTTGAGDATIAGLLMGLLRGMGPEEAARAATAVGACCCEASDALSGVQSWEKTLRRIESGWERIEG